MGRKRRFGSSADDDPSPKRNAKKISCFLSLSFPLFLTFYLSFFPSLLYLFLSLSLCRGKIRTSTDKDVCWRGWGIFERSREFRKPIWCQCDQRYSQGKEITFFNLAFGDQLVFVLSKIKKLVINKVVSTFFSLTYCILTS